MDGKRQNNFDALRLYAALMVIYGHGFNMAGGIGPGLWGVPFARVGLDVFFAISGYLVTDSWERVPRLSTYLWKRAVRILPGLTVCVLLTAFVLGPLVTTLPPADYFSNWRTYRYLTNIIFLQRLQLPGVFQGLHYNGVVNGSLWSLLPEVLCYLTAPLLALLALRYRLWCLVLGAVIAGGIGLFLFEGYAGPAIVIYSADLKYVLVQFPFFFFGAFYRLIEPRFPDLYRADVALLCFAANWSVASWFSWWNVPLEWFTLPYMVICFGRLSMPVLRHAARYGDLSYGMYLYAFPVQQLVLYAIPDSNYPIVACGLLTLPLAFLSWHLVEKPALRLKLWDPFRGWAAPQSDAGQLRRRQDNPPSAPPVAGAASKALRLSEQETR